MRETPTPSVSDVRNFWNEHPLFTGEGDASAGTKEWFLQHEKTIATDCLISPYDFSLLVPSNLNPTAKILDVGCGPGYWVRYFLSRGFQNITACDLTESAVELAKQSLRLFDLDKSWQGEVITGNAESLPFEDGTFDHVNCQGVIHHTPDTKACLHEFYRVLKPGGTVSFSVYHKNTILRFPVLFKFVQRVSRALKVGLSGRGRENMVAEAKTPAELVRVYDGADNPIGKAYTYKELLELMEYQDADGQNQQLFHNLKTGKFFFPARALPLALPLAVRRSLAKYAGLMIAVQGRKLK